MTFAGPLRRALYRLPSVRGSRLSLASPFVTTFREMLEMRYLWREPVRMDDARLIATLGQEPHAPTDACGSLVVLFATTSASVRPVQGSFARPSNLGHESFRLLDRRAAVWLKVARSPERQSLGASVTCTA